MRIVEVGWNGDDRVVDRPTKVRLGGLTHLGQHHRRNFLWCELFCLTLELDLDDWLATFVDDLEGEMLHVRLHLRICPLSADEAFGIENGVGRVHGDLVLRRVSDQTLGVGEGDERRRGSIALVVGNDFDAIITKDAYARVGRAQVNTDGWTGCHDVCM